MSTLDIGIPSEEQMTRVAADWSNIAGEKISVMLLGGTIYGFGSELACLRLYKKYLGKAHTDYSLNLKSWFFRMNRKPPERSPG